MKFSARVLAVLVGCCLIAVACGGGNDDRDDEFEQGTAYATGTVAATGTATVTPGATETATPSATGTSSTAGPLPKDSTDDSLSAPPPTAGTPPGADTPTNTDGNGQTGENTDPSAGPPAMVLTPVISRPDPIDLVARPGTGSSRGDLYVATRAGEVWLLTADQDEPPELVLDLGNATNTGCENGLLDIAFSADGSTFYAHYTDRSGDTRIVAYPMSGQGIQQDQVRTVLSARQPACNHNGGQITFGPDGYLWVGLGDGGGSNDMFSHGQDRDSILGAILRVDVDTDDGTNYVIPPDNPFADGGGRAEIWAYGARNPWRFSFDRATDDLWIADVGQNRWEEVHVLAADQGWTPGANLGWPLFEGEERFSGIATPDDLAFPVYVYGRDDGCSITGGHVYRGSAIPALAGTYVFGDFCAGRLWGLNLDDAGLATRIELGVSVPQATLVSFAEDNAGELYVLSFDDTVYRLDPSP